MPSIANWLVARPQNGVIALALMLLFPPAPILSGLVMTHLVLAQGIRLPLIQGAIAAGALVIVALVLNASIGQVVASAITWWLPVLVLAALARQTRSLTLALQVSAIAAVVVTLGYFIVLADPAAYWNEAIDSSIALAREAGLVEQANLLSESKDAVVPQMTMLFVLTAWCFYVLVTLGGYALYQQLPGREAAFGRFCDLNFGRVLATVMALASIGALATGANWLQNVSFVAFAVFWLQGLAILHWLAAEKRMPAMILVLAYVLLPILNVLLVIALAVVGYMDAWFNLRTRAGSNEGLEQ